MAANNYDGKYLSKLGLDTLWNKIKSVFLKKTDAGTLTVILELTDYFDVTTIDEEQQIIWSCTTVPPLNELIISQAKNVVFKYVGFYYRLRSHVFDSATQLYTYTFSLPNIMYTSGYDHYNGIETFSITIPASADPQPSEVSIYHTDVSNANYEHAHGNIANDGTDGQITHDTSKFLRADGQWAKPENVERSVYSSGTFDGVRICTTKVTNSGEPLYLVFSFSIINSEEGIDGIGASFLKPTSGIIQLSHSLHSTMGNVVRARITEYQPDSIFGLKIKYEIQPDGSVNSYLVVSSDVMNTMYNTRVGFYLMHKHVETGNSIINLTPQIMTDMNNRSTVDASGEAYKTPIIKSSTNGVGTPGKPAYISNGEIKQCTMMGSSSNNLLHDLHPDSFANEPNIYFCMLNQNWVKGGYLSLSEARQKINGTSVGSEKKPLYIDANGNVTAVSQTIGSVYQPIWIYNGVIRTTATWWKTTIVSSNTTVNLLGTPYSSAPAGAIVVVSNVYSSAINVTYKSNTNTQVSSGRNRVFIKLNTTPEWGWDN